MATKKNQKKIEESIESMDQSVKDMEKAIAAAPHAKAPIAHAPGPITEEEPVSKDEAEKLDDENGDSNSETHGEEDKECTCT